MMVILWEPCGARLSQKRLLRHQSRLYLYSKNFPKRAWRTFVVSVSVAIHQTLQPYNFGPRHVLPAILFLLVYRGSPRVSPAWHGNSRWTAEATLRFLLYLGTLLRHLFEEAIVLHLHPAQFFGFYFFWPPSHPGENAAASVNSTRNWQQDRVF